MPIRSLRLRQYEDIPEEMSEMIRLGNDEEILSVIHWSWIVMLQTIIGAFGMFVCFTTGVIVLELPTIAIVAIAIVSLIILIGGLMNDILYRKKTGTVVTDQRIVKSYASLFNKKTEELRMSDINHIKTRKSGVLGFYKTNKVIVSSHERELKIPTVNANDLAEKIRSIKNNVK